MDKIEKCPEGHKAEIIGKVRFFISCSHIESCWNGPLANTKNGAIKKWNRVLGKSKEFLRKAKRAAYDRGYKDG